MTDPSDEAGAGLGLPVLVALRGSFLGGNTRGGTIVVGRRASAEGRIDPDRLVSYERIYEEVSVPPWSTGRRRGT